MTRNSQTRSAHAQRRLATERRLRSALQRLVDGNPRHKSLRGRRLTVAVLAHEAKVSRNTIYTNHRALIDELGCHAGSKQRPRKQIESAPQALIATLQQDVRNLASQNAALLKRAMDAESNLARLTKQNARVVAEIAALRAPTDLRRRHD